jgi:hypothetical protein
MPSSNTVNLTSSLIESVSYVDGSLVITSGEEYKVPPSITQDGPKWIIELAPDGGGTGKQPDKLNFYFAVRVTFNIGGNRVQETIYLAQGHFSLTNNWWIGGNHVVNAGQPEYLVMSDNVIRQIFKLSGNTNSFTFTSVG